MKRQTILELDINTDSLLKRTADIKQEIDKLTNKTKDYKSVIKATDTAINQHTTTLINLENQGKQNTDEYLKEQEALKKATEQNQQYRLKLEQSLGTKKKMQAEYRLAQKTMNAYSKTANEQIGIMEKTDGSIDQISVALSNNKKVYKSLTKEQRENEAIGGKLLKLIKKQDAEYKELHKSIGNNNVDVGNYKGQMQELIRENGNLGNSTNKVITNIVNFQNNLTQTKTALQSIKPAMKQLGASMKKFFASPWGVVIGAVAAIGAGIKSWVSYNLEIEKTNKLVRALTQESGQSVDAIRMRAEVLQESFGVDMKESIETAKSMAKNFGISYEEAFDIIENGALRGKTSNAEYLDSLKEYPVQFKNAGFSAKEFARIVETGIDMSIYQDKLPDGVKEFGLSITEMTKASKDALKNAFGAKFTNELAKKIKTNGITVKDAFAQISAQAKKVGLNSQQAQQLTADLFKGAGEDAGGALKIFDAVNKALNEQEKPLTEIQKLKKEELELNKELKGISKQLFGENSKGFTKLKSQIKNFATKTLINLLKRGVDIYNWFVELNNTSGTFSAILVGIGKVATATFEVIGILIDRATDLFSGLGDIVKGIFTLDWDAVEAGWDKAGNSLEGVIDDLVKKAEKDFNDIYDAFEGKNKMKKITLETIVANEVTDTPNPIQTNTNGNTNGNGTGTKKDKKIQDAKEIADAEIKAMELVLQKRLLEEDIVSNSVKNRVQLYKDAYEQELKILKAKLQAGKLTQEEYDLAAAQSKKKYAQKETDVVIEAMNKELELYIAKNKSVLDSEQKLTDTLVANEKARLLEIYEQKLQILETQKEQQLVSEQEFNLLKLNLHQEYLTQKKELDNAFLEQKQEADTAAYDSLVQAIENENNFKYDALIAQLDREKAAELKAKNLTTAQKQAIDKKYNDLKDKARNRQAQLEDEKLKAYELTATKTFGAVKAIFKENTIAYKLASIAEVTINTAKAAMAAYSAVVSIIPAGPVLAPIAAAAAIAMGTAQLTKIKGIDANFQDGGMITGKSHAQGGVPFTVNGMPGFEAEGGEYIVNRKATRLFLPLLETINNKYKVGHQIPHFYQTGGVIPTHTQQAQINELKIDYSKLAEVVEYGMVKANQSSPAPIVSVQEISNAQTEQNQIETNIKEAV